MNQDQVKSTGKVWNALFIQIFTANALMNLSQQMMGSLVSKYANALGAAATMIGVVSSIYALTALIFKILSGPFIDTYNKRYILSITMTVTAVAFFGFGISTSVPMMVAFRLLQGVGQAFTSTCCLAVATATLPKEKLGSGIGVFGMAHAVSQAIGPALTLALVDSIGYQATFFTGCGIMLLAAVFALRVNLPFTRTKRLELKPKRIIAKPALLPASINFLLAVTYFVINSFLILYAESLGVKGIGYYFTVCAGCMIFTRPLAGRMVDRVGAVRTMIPSMLCFALSFLIISFSRTLPMFLVAAFFAAFGYGAGSLVLQALCMKSVPASERGAASSTSYVGNDLGSLIGPILAGKVVELFHNDYVPMWRVMIIPIFLAMAVMLTCRKRITKIEMDFNQAGPSEA